MLTSTLALAGGTAFALAGWQLPRRVARARLRFSPWLLLDAVPPLIVFLLLAAANSKPLFAGAVTFLLCSGYAYADRAKRRVLAEPIVFTDLFQTMDIFKHPELAVPFPHKWRTLGVIMAAVTFFVAVPWLEPASWTPGFVPLLALLVCAALAAWAIGGPLNQRVGAALARLDLSQEPVGDGARLGPFAALMVHGLLARAQRSSRQAAAPAPRGGKPAGAASGFSPLVVVQCESFFDIRRLHPSLDQATLLPAYERSCRNAAQWGRLTVPSWGANTVRTEFAVLTGLSQSALGLDRFNPYHRFAGRPLGSLAWNLRARGYRTICLHPFDRRFYRRDVVMPNLGFEVFLGEEAFAGAKRVNGYVADVEAARVAAEILREEGNRCFLFVITMENHGPWPPVADGADLLPLQQLPAGSGLAERGSLARYLRSLSGADAMLDLLTGALRNRHPGSTLALYGDHLPSFPKTYAQLGLPDSRSDYLIWRAQGGSGARVDLEAAELGAAVLRAHQGGDVAATSRPVPRGAGVMVNAGAAG